MSRTIKTAIIAFAVAASLAPAALAEAGREQVSIRVAYTDLDMSTPEGGKTLLVRIEGAARRICKDFAPSAQPDYHNPYRCQRRAVESVVRGVDMRMLTLAWDGKDRTTTLASR